MKKSMIHMIESLEEMIDQRYSSREASLAKTKLEEAAMWLEKCEDKTNFSASMSSMAE